MSKGGFNAPPKFGALCVHTKCCLPPSLCMHQKEGRWLLQDDAGSPVKTLNVLAEHVDAAVQRLLAVIDNPENGISKEGNVQTATKCKQGRLGW